MNAKYFEQFTQPMRLLRHRHYRSILLSALMTYTVRAGELTLLGWLMLDLTSSPLYVTLIGLSMGLPFLLFGLSLGAIVDKTSKRQMLSVAQGLPLTTIMILTMLIATGSVAPIHILVGAFISGAGFTTDFLARKALIATLVPKDSIATAASLDMTTLFLSFLLGPATAGILIGLAGFTVAYALLFPILVCSLIIVLKSPLDTPAALPRHRSSIQQGLDIVARNRPLLAAFVITVVANFCAFPYTFLLPVIAQQSLSLGPIAYGLLSSAPGLGALPSALVIGNLPLSISSRVFCASSLILLAAIIIFALSTSFVLSLAVLFFGGFGFAGFAVLQTTIVLHGTKPEIHGQALGVIALGIGTQPLGALVMGVLSEVMNPNIALAGMAALGLLLVFVISLILRLWWAAPQTD